MTFVFQGKLTFCGLYAGNIFKIAPPTEIKLRAELGSSKSGLNDVPVDAGTALILIP